MKQALFRVIAAQVARLASASHAITVRPDIIQDAKTRIRANVKEYMPSGSGVDNGTYLDPDDCKNGKLVFTTAFHHMDAHGGYDGWTEHKVIVTPSLQWDFDLRITGRDRNGIKEYLYDLFNTALKQLVEDGTFLERREDRALTIMKDMLLDAPASALATESHKRAITFINRANGDFSA